MLADQLQEALSAPSDDDWKNTDDVLQKFVAAHKKWGKVMADNIHRITGWKATAAPGGWSTMITVETSLKRSNGGAWALYLTFGSQANYRTREITLTVAMESPLGMDAEIRTLWEAGGSAVYALSVLQQRYGLTSSPYHNQVKYGTHLSFPISKADEVLADMNKITGDISGEYGRALKKAAAAMT